jgi:hypothetical protein
MRSVQDTDLWIRIALKYKVAFCSKATANKIINFDEYHLSNSKFKSDRLKIFSFFVDEESINHSLKEYLDLNRLSMAIECKIQGDEENYKILRKLIDENHLNFTQKILLRSSKIGLVFLKKIQLWLIMKKIYLTPFKR